MRRSRSLPLFVALLILLPFVTGADKPKKKETQETTVREEAVVTLIEVPVNVTDKDGRPVENLKQEDFEVYDDGKKQTITGFDVLDQRGTVVPTVATNRPASEGPPEPKRAAAPQPAPAPLPEKLTPVPASKSGDFSLT